MSESIRQWRCERVSAADDGDGFQVVFENAPAGNGEYVLIQRHFESPDNGKCYIETDDPACCGHFPIARAQLSRTKLTLSLVKGPVKKLVVSFAATEADYAEAKRILRIMIERVEVHE